MTNVFENAVASIVVGVEDYENGAAPRILSAARNYYSGLLLLAKECLIRSAPDTDPMDVIGQRFEPALDADGGVKYELVGHTTIDLSQLQQRFKRFKLPWPDVDIRKLQRFRNDIEHYHLKEPTETLREAIASSFPMIVDFFAILEEDPQANLGQAWSTILSEKKAFEKVSQTCLSSLEPLEWPGPVEHLDRLECPNCSSSLIAQQDPENTQTSFAIGTCVRCGSEIGSEKFAELVVDASFGVAAFHAARDGDDAMIGTCPDCGVEAYVDIGDISSCYNCGSSIGNQCDFCQARITLNEYNDDYPDLCGNCSHIMGKAMRD